MEYYNTKDAGVAGRIFELGYKTLSEKNDDEMDLFISHYLDFLIQMNDENSKIAHSIFQCSDIVCNVMPIVYYRHKSVI